MRATHKQPPELRCFHCEGPVRTEWRNETFVYGADDDAVELSAHIPVEVCDACGATMIGPEAEDLQHEAVCAHLGVLPPRAIRQIRERHGLTRSAFAELTGLGTASLARWEKALLIQNVANDRYLRLLREPRNVERLRELSGGAEVIPGPWHADFRYTESISVTEYSAGDFRVRRAHAA